MGAKGEFEVSNLVKQMTHHERGKISASLSTFDVRLRLSREGGVYWGAGTGQKPSEEIITTNKCCTSVESYPLFLTYHLVQLCLSFFLILAVLT